jgi:hypothetical protein
MSGVGLKLEQLRLRLKFNRHCGIVCKGVKQNPENAATLPGRQTAHFAGWSSRHWLDTSRMYVANPLHRTCIELRSTRSGITIGRT